MDWLDHDRLGWNYRLTEMQAAIGVAQLERLEELLAARERVARLYGERLAALDSAAPAGGGDPGGPGAPGARAGLRAPDLVRLHGAGFPPAPIATR